MGLFRKKTPATAAPSVPPADVQPLDDLRVELAAMRERLDATDREKAELAATVAALQQRLLDATPPPPVAPPPAAPPPAPPPTVEPVPDLTDVTDELQRRLSALDERVARLDERVTSVSTELANQLTEVGNDIEPIQAGAERLAAEQARYQIQFRQDLAELAERLRRSH